MPIEQMKLSNEIGVRLAGWQLYDNTTMIVMVLRQAIKEGVCDPNTIHARQRGYLEAETRFALGSGLSAGELVRWGYS
jgi:hypothetical protein